MKFKALKVSLLVISLSLSLSASAENIPDEQFSAARIDAANSDEIGVFFEENVTRCECQQFFSHMGLPQEELALKISALD